MSSYWSFNSKKKEINIEMKSKETNKYGFEIEPDNVTVDALNKWRELGPIRLTDIIENSESTINTEIYF